ncbi:glutathione S-transferase [Phanerochaete sordida]|uniref:glutathione transferase n=1 Tax=Phanerochaete sordida TaxID=48140 RepID=A0A9P3GK55_9APHY|nr:glutathione S-transferase [Phanerochaete sordida]
MVLKLHGSPISTCTKRVAAVLHEKHVPFELVPVDFAKGEHKSAAHRAKQPFGQVPYIDDDGFVLYESRAIARYVAAKYAAQGTPLVPSTSDLKATALFEQAVSVEGSNFDPFASGLAYEKVFIPMRGGATNEAHVEYLAKTLDMKLDGYEAILSKQKYLAGDEITLADLFHLPYGAFLKRLDYNYLEDPVKRPNVARWWKDITSRPSWQAVQEKVESSL